MTTGLPARTLPVDEDGVVALTRDLVRLRTVHEPERGAGEGPAAALVAETMRGFGWEPQVTEVAPGRPNVVAVVEGGGGPGPTLAFEGHTDVVTEGDRDRWSVDPYGGEIRDGRLYGRGSADMKSVIPARATVCVDVRTIPGVDHAALVAGVREPAVEAGAPSGVTAEVTVIDDRACVEVAKDHPLVRCAHVYAEAARRFLTSSEGDHEL